MLLVPSLSFAALDITGVSVTPNPSLPSGEVTVGATVNRTGTGTSNDWMSSRITINGVNFCTETDHALFPADINNPFIGAAATSTDSATTTAPSTDGDYEVNVKVYRESGCSNLQDQATTSLKVLTPAPPTPPQKVEPVTHHRGGDRARCVETNIGLYCPNPQAREQYIINLMAQIIQLLQQLIALKASA